MKVYLVERLFGLNEILEAYLSKVLAEEKCRELTITTGDAWVVKTCPLYLDYHRGRSDASKDLKEQYNED